MVVESLFVFGTIWMYSRRNIILYLDFVLYKLVDTVELL